MFRFAKAVAFSALTAACFALSASPVYADKLGERTLNKITEQSWTAHKTLVPGAKEWRVSLGSENYPDSCLIIKNVSDSNRLTVGLGIIDTNSSIFYDFIVKDCKYWVAFRVDENKILKGRLYWSGTAKPAVFFELPSDCQYLDNLLSQLETGKYLRVKVTGKPEYSEQKSIVMRFNLSGAKEILDAVKADADADFGELGKRKGNPDFNYFK